MGRILQIRVSAWTYDEDEVLQAWPKLCALVWSQLDQWGPAGMKRGVTELAGYLPDALRFSDLPDDVKRALLPGVKNVAAILEEMRKALADWEPRRANALSDVLEEALFELEKEAPRELLELK
ncbi:MAG: formin-like protein 18 [Mailhella sp.]|nr:formin-like protein 18 [Mailhella sp.]